MNARLIYDSSNKLVLLCKDGTICRPTRVMLAQLLSNFKRKDGYFTGGPARWDTEYGDMMLYPGTTVAYISDGMELVIRDIEPFQFLLNGQQNPAKYISVAEFAKKHNKSIEMVKVYCRDGRIPGAIKPARNWMIPENAEYPVDPAFQRTDTKGGRRKG